jgi:hypothetical protein
MIGSCLLDDRDRTYAILRVSRPSSARSHASRMATCARSNSPVRASAVASSAKISARSPATPSSSIGPTARDEMLAVVQDQKRALSGEKLQQPGAGVAARPRVVGDRSLAFPGTDRG